MVADSPELMRMFTLEPSTYKNNSIVAMELQSDRNTRKPGLLIIGALDGMVWAASNAVTYLAQKLLYDASFQSPFFNDYDWYLIPLANPDGIDLTYSFRNHPKIPTDIWSRNETVKIGKSPERWHKNQENISESKCFGININRNFAYHWQDDYSRSPDRCSQYYSGDKPFSTREAKAMQQYLDSLGNKIHMAIVLDANFEPKKESILYPWTYSKRRNSNYIALQTIGEYAARLSRLSGGRLYEVHQSSTENREPGSISDYIAGVLGTELVFILKPYHELYPNFTDRGPRDLYVKKSISVILNLVRGWRSNEKQNTLWFYGREVDF